MKQKISSLFCRSCRIPKPDDQKEGWKFQICPGYVVMFIAGIALVIMELSK